MPDPQRHADDRNFVEGILRHIPGFKGYLEKEYRRESDYLARTWMADQLRASKRGMDDYLRELVSNAQLDDLPRFEQVRARLDGLESRIRSQVRGYSGFFDYVRVDEDLLDRVYQHDVAMFEEIEALAADVGQISGKYETPAEAAKDLLRRIDEVEREFLKRGEMLKGVGQE